MKIKSTLWLLLLFLLIVVNNCFFYPSNIISWDVFGYYMYLPLKFIYNDLSIHNFSTIEHLMQTYHFSDTLYQAAQLENSGYVLKYTMGMSIFYAPFFFIGHLIALLSHFPADGFSAPYQHALFAGNLLYTFVGIVILFKVLKKFFSEKISLLVVYLLFFATNYLITISIHGQNATPHNVLFTAYTLILWLTVKWHETPKIKYIIFLSIICGLSILSRPTEIICIAIPLFWGIFNKETFYKKLILLKEKYGQIILFIIILLAIGSLQFIYWKIHVGKFIYTDYGDNYGEGMDFLNPHIWQILFSFRKGWFIYTPVMFLAVLGFIPMYRKNRPLFFALTLFVIANIYLTSCWSCWWYAFSFSQRALVQSYPVMAIGLGYFIQYCFEKNRLIKSASIFLIVALTFLNLFQIGQFMHGVIDGERMTKSYYFAVFGKIQATEADKTLLLIERPYDGREVFANQEKYQLHFSFTNNYDEDEFIDTVCDNKVVRGILLHEGCIFSPDIEIPFYELCHTDHAWIRVTVNVFPVTDLEITSFSVIAQFNYKEWAYKYRGFDSKNMNIETRKTNEIVIEYLTPEVRTVSDKFKTYIWFQGTGMLLVESIKVEAFCLE